MWQSSGLIHCGTNNQLLNYASRTKLSRWGMQTLKLEINLKLLPVAGRFPFWRRINSSAKKPASRFDRSCAFSLQGSANIMPARREETSCAYCIP